MQISTDRSFETATLAGGCFWCLEAPLQHLAGVQSVISGYMGGHAETATYKQVCNGDTGHAEVIQVQFDPAQISYGDLLEIFFALHDPTTLNRQGHDIGTQYRSAVFYHSEAQRIAVQQTIAQLTQDAVWPDPIVTAVVPATKFYPAEEYHQHYFERNPFQPFCMAVVAPKVAKLRAKFADRLKRGG